MSSLLSLSNWYTFSHFKAPQPMNLIGLLQTSSNPADLLAAKALTLRASAGPSSGAVAPAINALLKDTTVQTEVRRAAQATYTATVSTLSSVYSAHTDLGSEAQVAELARQTYTNLAKAVEDFNTRLDSVITRAKDLLAKRQTFFDTFRAYGCTDETIENIAVYFPDTPLKPIDAEKEVSSWRSQVTSLIQQFEASFDVTGDMVSEKEDGTLSLSAFTASFKRSAFGNPVITFYGGGAERPQTPGNYEALAAPASRGTAPSLEQALFTPPAAQTLSQRLAQSDSPVDRMAAGLFERCKKKTITTTQANAEIMASDLPNYRKNEARATFAQLWRTRNNPAPYRMGGTADLASATQATQTALDSFSEISNTLNAYNALLGSYKNTADWIATQGPALVDHFAALDVQAKVATIKAEATKNKTEPVIDLEAITAQARTDAEERVRVQFSAYDTIFPNMRFQIADAAKALGKAVVAFTDRFPVSNTPLVSADADGFAVMSPFSATWTPQGASQPAITFKFGMEIVEGEANVLNLDSYVDPTEFAKSLTTLPAPLPSAASGLDKAA